MRHPKDIGDHSTLAIMYGLTSIGYELLLPFGENTRYDLVINDGVAFFRVQCKTGRLKNGAILFPTASTYAHHPNPKISRRSYEGEIDFFAVFCPETGGVYLVPIDGLPTRSSAMLRVEPARNRQVRGIRNAAKYEVARLPSAGRDSGASSGPGVRAGGSGSCA